MNDNLQNPAITIKTPFDEVFVHTVGNFWKFSVEINLLSKVG